MKVEIPEGVTGSAEFAKLGTERGMGEGMRASADVFDRLKNFLGGRRVTYYRVAAAPEPQLAVSKSAGGGEQSSEQEAAAAGGGEQRYAVEMFGLRKVFRTGRVPFRKKEFVAVRGNWLGIREGERRGKRPASTAPIAARA